MRLFRYSGNKAKLAALYDLPQRPFKRIVEPYLGSGAFSLRHCEGKDVLGYEINEDLYDMWMWLKTVSPDQLIELYDFVEDLKTKEDKPDLRSVNLENGPLTYLRVNVCSVMIGQLSSWKVYPQHKLPVKKTIECLPLIRNFEIVLGNGEDYISKDGDLAFIDPPYLNTTGNYKSTKNARIETSYDPRTTVDLISRLSCPIIFTYGTNAPDIFPQFDWKLIKQIKVPNIRSGGTVDRMEYAAYINF